jgi:hypothetical protein
VEHLTKTALQRPPTLSSFVAATTRNALVLLIPRNISYHTLTSWMYTQAFHTSRNVEVLISFTFTMLLFAEMTLEVNSQPSPGGAAFCSCFSLTCSSLIEVVSYSLLYKSAQASRSLAFFFPPHYTHHTISCSCPLLSKGSSASSSSPYSLYPTLPSKFLVSLTSSHESGLDTRSPAH